MTEPHIGPSAELIETIFRRELLPALDAYRLPIERIWETAQITQEGVGFSSPSHGEIPSVRVNATKQELTFRVAEQGPFRITAAAIQRIIDERKKSE